MTITERLRKNHADFGRKVEEMGMSGAAGVLEPEQPPELGTQGRQFAYGAVGESSGGAA